MTRHDLPLTGPPLLNRIAALQQPQTQVRNVDILPWLFGTAIVVIFASLIAIGLSLQP